MKIQFITGPEKIKLMWKDLQVIQIQISSNHDIMVQGGTTSVNFTQECIGKIFPRTAELIFLILLNNELCPLFPLSYICKLENVNTCTYMLNFFVLHELLVHLHLYSELSSQAKNMAKACSVYHICLPSVHLIPFSFILRELFRTC